ncbi:hypothetical protein GGX14DRAFT_370187 [Mycena pura]|uniref:SET domain-containing protein n=1 Tax=Mycena pura TaxID=153505 RepID=A0AAD6V490_9AGAR|nr:hypothetical protein GGX14DRAFT_370187 [Mycena pura]
MRTHDSPPPLHLCAQLNADIRANPALDAPYFDLAGHAESRAYCVSGVLYADATTETAALLDVGVQRLLPTPVPVPRATTCSKGATFSIRPAGSAREDRHRGLGVFAAQAIPAGGIILVERPVLVAPYIIGPGTQPPTESELFAILLRRLSLETAARVVALANCRPAAECDDLVGIVRTNAIAITLAVPAGPHPELAAHRGVFLNASRCNHSCAPNARHDWDPTSLSLALTAVRPIPAGDEITVSYIPLEQPLSARRALLQATYNFACACTACVRPAAAAASDAARAELRSFWERTPAFETWVADRRLRDTLLADAHARAVALIEAEGLEGLTEYARHLDALAMAYGALGDVGRFRAWAWRARDARPVGDADAARVLQGWITHPETFPVWRWRQMVVKA